LSSLAPFPFVPTPGPTSTKLHRTAVRQSLSALQAILAESILPLLIARTAQLETTPETTEVLPNLLTTRTDPDRVKAFRSSLSTLTQPSILKQRGLPRERLAKLIWSLALRDGAALLMHGLPECLRSTEGDWKELPDAALYQCWLNLSFATEVIPCNRMSDYRPILQLIQRAAKQASRSTQPGALNR
jgi:hypothetical protein